MSHEIVKSIAIKDNKVYLTSADSSVRPLYFNRWECSAYSKILSEQGKDALYAKIGEEVWNGNLEIRQGSRLCKLYLEARNAFPTGMNFLSLDACAAGKFLGKMVTRLEKDSRADLSDCVNQALALQNDKDYILEAAKRTGHNFLNHAGPEVQKDRAFALEVLRAGHGAAWFDYPMEYKDDREFALEAVKLNGCFYRYLGETLKADREIIMEAYREMPDKTYHEHLPDIIPTAALLDFESDPTRPALDKKFILALLDACPSMHLFRSPYLLQERDIALKWVQVGSFFPYSVGDLPKQYLTDRAFQDTLYKRFEGTDRLDVLLKRFADMGIQLNKRYLDSRIQSASNRAVTAQISSQVKNKELESER